MKIQTLFSICIGVLILSACGSSTDSSPSGRMTLNITDAPVDEADAVVIEFTSVTLKSEDDEELVFDFSSNPKTLDLLALQGLVSAPLIEDEIIPAGEYSQIRLGVNAEFDGDMDSYITIDGTDYELRVPSGSQTGLKLNTTFTVDPLDEPNADINSVYTIDFDLRKSIVEPIGQPGYFLKPSLRLVRNVNTGSISGLVDASLLTGTNCSDSDPLTGNAVYLFAGHDIQPNDFIDMADDTMDQPLTSALVAYHDDGNGISYSYEIGYLAAADYTLAFTCSADLDLEGDDADVIFDVIDNVSVTAGENIDHPID